MNIDSATETVSHLSPGSYSGVSGESKYGGLLQQSLAKKMRNSIYMMLNYIDEVVPTFYPMHAVISLFRIFQIIGPALFAQYYCYWENGSLEKTCVSTLSVLYTVLPPESQRQYSIIISFVYFIFTFIFFATTSFAAPYFQKNAKLPKFVAYYISIYTGTFFMLLTPIGLNLAFGEIGRLIMNTGVQEQRTSEIAVIILVVIVSLAALWYFTNIIAISLAFRPISLMTVLERPQIAISLGYIGLVIFSSLGSELPKIGRIVCVILMIASYGVMIGMLFLPGGLITNWHNNMILASCITGIVSCIIAIVFEAIGKKFNIVMLFVLLGIFVIAMIVSTIIMNQRMQRHLNLLDRFVDTRNGDGIFTSATKLLCAITTGMKYAHPVCLDWSIFRYGIDQWPLNISLWATFGKFVAIFPSEDNLLSFVSCNIMTKHLKGSLAKQTIIQAHNIMTQRETALSPSLKMKITKLSKQVLQTKQKLRQIWDLVIQGNIGEMDQCINSAYRSVNKSSTEFNHLLSQYPNNRFVSRQYTRFLFDVLADQKRYLEWSEKTRSLMRGVMVNQDRTNALGIHAFPSLPHSLEQGGNVKSNTNIESESAFSMDQTTTELDEEQLIANADHMNLIREQIDHLKFPATKCVAISTLFILIVLIYVPIIIALVTNTSIIADCKKPMELMYYLSFSRSLEYFVPLFAHHYLLENIIPTGSTDPVFPHPWLEFKPKSLGSTELTHDQCRYLLGAIVTSMEKLGKYRSFTDSDKTLSIVSDVTFGDKCSYVKYTTKTQKTDGQSSFISALMETVNRITQLIDEPPTANAFDSPNLLNPFYNADSMSSCVSTALEQIKLYIINFFRQNKKTVTILQVSCTIVYVIIIILSAVIEFKLIGKNKEEVYKCLTALPKNVVSQMTESLRIIKKDETNTRSSEMNSELSKQEDNIIKVFNAASDNMSNASLDKVSIVVCHVLILLCIGVAFNFSVSINAQITRKLQQSAPHLDNILGASGFMAGAVMSMNNAVASTVDANLLIGNLTLDDLLDNSKTLVGNVNYYFNYAEFGQGDSNKPPYHGFPSTLDSKFGCVKETDAPTSIRDSYRCFMPDEQVYLFHTFVTRIINEVKAVGTIDSHDAMLNEIWPMALVNLYDLYFIPIFDRIVDDLTAGMESIVPIVIAVSSVMMCIMLILEIIILSFNSLISKKMRFALTLLLHAPPQIVMQTPKIMDVLSGNFKDSSKDVISRKTEFYDDLIMNVPDSIIIANQSGQIILVNRASERIYQVKAEDLMNKDIHDFLSSSSFQSSVTSILTDQNKLLTAVYKTNDSQVHLQLSCSQILQQTVITCRDYTQTVTYNTLIQEERAKSDKLLSSILPANLVRRVEAGEKNISFAVQSASILFWDIVEFTPWCASHDAAMVMSTLNILFKECDSALSKYSTMTKIKCIGDCYMCAGGIFSEVNQPAVHSRETVDFGLDCLDNVTKLNENIGTELRIRVGINTGGPLVAGVLGTEKPTFEILGPPINMAQQMEHHGVPMSVHISRPVYELVYGGYFVIKERGEIEIKSGNVLTYLVQGRTK